MVDTPVEPTAKELYQTQIKYWRRMAMGLGTSLLFLFAFVVWSVWLLNGTAEDTNRTVVILEQATSPAAQERNANVVKDLINDVDCNNRDALQQFIEELESQQIIDYFTVECSDGR